MMSKSKNEYIAVGGQALMEGIMMRGPKGTAMSLRLPDGSIETSMKNFVSVRKKYKVLNLPIIRGVVSFVESMIFGYKLLMESAEKTSLDFEEEQNESKLDKWLSDHFGPKMMAVIGVISAVLGFGLAFVLFMWLPSFLFDIVNGKLAHGAIDVAFRALFEGVIRVIIFIVYMALVARMKEIHRTYMYHGAEHKTIFCFEHGKELTVENIKKESRYHPRCGTSFIFMTILLSILVSSLVAVIFRGTVITKIRPLWILVKLLIMPAIMGIGFEFIQLAGKYPNKLTKALSAPGLLMQRITTAEPDEAIIEVAIESMKAALYGDTETLVKPGEEKKNEAEAENDTTENEE